MNKLFEELGKHVPLSENFIADLHKCASQIRLKSRTKILQPSQNQENLIFITDGITRNYYREGDKEWTSFFSQRGDFVLSLDNFLFGLPCVEHIECCTALEGIKVPKGNYKELIILYPELNNLEKAIMNQRLTNSISRMYNWRMLSASDRYYKFIEENQQLSRQLQLQHIATYLDITPFSLSRIRRQYRNRKKHKSLAV